MMARVLVPLILTVLLAETSASLSPSGTEQTSSCPPRWLQFGQRCFAFYPVWSSWSNADSTCSLAGGRLASLHTSEERQFVHQLARTHIPVWLGGYLAPQTGSWVWNDNSSFSISGLINQSQVEIREGGTCVQMETKSGGLHGAPCGDLRFYICSTRNSSEFLHENKEPVRHGLSPGASLFDAIWGHSFSVAETILRSSSFLKDLSSGRLTQSCYTRFMQQEALYLHRVSSTLEALISGLQEADDMRSLLLDTLKHYNSSRNQSLLASPPPQWLQFSLLSFRSVVLEEPIYWLVALSARASLRSFLARRQLHSEHSTDTPLVTEVKASSFYQEWSEESQKEVAWTQRYRKVLEEYQNHMKPFKAINIFRVHMTNQKSFYKALDCDVVDDK